MALAVLNTKQAARGAQTVDAEEESRGAPSVDNARNAKKREQLRWLQIPDPPTTWSVAAM